MSTTYSGFLPVAVSPSVSLFVKQDSTLPNSLFIANIPYSNSINLIRSLFPSLSSAVSSISFLPRPQQQVLLQRPCIDLLPNLLPSSLPQLHHQPSNSCHVTFESEEELEQQWNRLKLRNGQIARGGDDDEEEEEEEMDVEKQQQVPIGLSKWLSSHSHTPDESLISARVSAHLAAFDAMHAEKRRQAAALEGVADEDGFITVTRKRRGGGGGIGDDDENNTDVANGRRNKKKKVELVDFYRFQMRETKRQRKGLEDTLWREEIESDREGE